MPVTRNAGAASRATSAAHRIIRTADCEPSHAHIRVNGIGTIYYLLYAIGRGGFSEREPLWAIAGAAILASVVAHGIVSTPSMLYADRLRKRHDSKAD